ncbi:MAG: HAD-IIB family hydrolase [Epsilonproteobacteria bacterium]|nr:HAD-IIB family hydrolase [Campylobacterota bacterium]
MELFVSDLDKTFLRSDLSVSEFSKKVWNSFPLPLTIATARSFTGATKLLKGLRLNYPLILLDGVMISLPTGEILELNALNKELTNSIIATISNKFSQEPLVVSLKNSTEQFLYPKSPNSFQLKLLETFHNDRRVFDLTQIGEDNLKIVYLGGKEELEEIKKELKEYPLELKLSKDPYLDCYFLTLLHPLGDKAYALRRLKEMLNISKVTVFGDSYNDLGMFEEAEVKIAVANAVKELKQKATLTLSRSNDEDGVAHYLSTL